MLLNFYLGCWLSNIYSYQLMLFFFALYSSCYPIITQSTPNRYTHSDEIKRTFWVNKMLFDSLSIYGAYHIFFFAPAFFLLFYRFLIFSRIIRLIFSSSVYFLWFGKPLEWTIQKVLIWIKWFLPLKVVWWLKWGKKKRQRENEVWVLWTLWHGRFFNFLSYIRIIVFQSLSFVWFSLKFYLFHPHNSCSCPCLPCIVFI